MPARRSWERMLEGGIVILWVEFGRSRCSWKVRVSPLQSSCMVKFQLKTKRTGEEREIYVLRNQC